MWGSPHASLTERTPLLRVQEPLPRRRRRGAVAGAVALALTASAFLASRATTARASAALARRGGRGAAVCVSGDASRLELASKLRRLAPPLAELHGPVDVVLALDDAGEDATREGLAAATKASPHARAAARISSSECLCAQSLARAWSGSGGRALGCISSVAARGSSGLVAARASRRRPRRSNAPSRALDHLVEPLAPIWRCARGEVATPTRPQVGDATWAPPSDRRRSNATRLSRDTYAADARCATAFGSLATARGRPRGAGAALSSRSFLASRGAAAGASRATILSFRGRPNLSFPRRRRRGVAFDDRFAVV